MEAKSISIVFGLVSNKQTTNHYKTASVITSYSFHHRKHEKGIKELYNVP